MLMLADAVSEYVRVSAPVPATSVAVLDTCIRVCAHRVWWGMCSWWQPC
jgi:hypothetical protein